MVGRLGGRRGCRCYRKSNVFVLDSDRRHLGASRSDVPVRLHGRRAQHNYQNGIVGLFERVELGYANDFNGWTVTGCKVLLSESETGAVSVGLMNYDGHHADPFAVGRLDFKGWRAHGGVIRDDRHRIVLGADFELPHGWSGMADWTSGPNGYGWVGVNIPVRGIPGLNVMPMVGFPNTKGDGIQHSVNVWFGFRF